MTDLAFLMSTVTKNVDVLEIHKYLFEKYWTDCKIQKYLTINADVDAYPQFLNLYNKIFYSGAHTDNYEGLIFALKKIEEPYIIFSLEDHGRRYKGQGMGARVIALQKRFSWYKTCLITAQMLAC